MDNEQKPQNEPDVSILAHPMGAVFALVVGILALADSYSRMHAPKELLTALVVGVPICLPIVLIQKWLLRRYKDAYVQYSMTPFWQRSWQVGKVPMLCGLPMGVAVFGSFVIDFYLHLPDMTTAAILCMFGVLGYPEQKAIWVAAKARVAEMEK